MKGARALALPTKKGQSMKIQELSGSEILWNSYDEKGNKWFSAELDLIGFDIVESSDMEKAKKLRKILRAAVQNNSEFLSHWKKYKIETHLQFPMEWGLGSSSTLYYNISQWADVNVFHLYFDVEEGSGYDVACAGADGPIFYQLGDGQLDYSEVDFKPSFHKSLYFVPLQHKIQSEEAIKSVKNKSASKDLIKTVSDLSDHLMQISSLSAFNNWVEEHEKIIGNWLRQKPIKQERFSDYWGAVKSLGAWGGDMILITSDKSKDDTLSYFTSKGLQQIIPFEELVL